MHSYLFPLVAFFGGFVVAWNMATICARWKHQDLLAAIDARWKRECAKLAVRKFGEGLRSRDLAKLAAELDANGLRTHQEN